LHETYAASQQGWLLDFETFIALLREKQRMASY
jgi:hypothetical protein